MKNALDTLIDIGAIKQDIIYDPSMFFGADTNPLACLVGFVQKLDGDGIDTADAAMATRPLAAEGRGYCDHCARWHRQEHDRHRAGAVALRLRRSPGRARSP